jgi:DNA-binding LytR/AlgR family response regulator
MIFYALGEFYLLSRANSRLNFQHYKARHRPPGIETLIPAGKQGALISISAQDHYVEIVTTGGRHLERLTMKEAVARAPEGDGIQVHRSHWVALEAIVRLEKSGGGHSVVLTNGARLPVGQPRLADVQAALRARLRESAETRKEPAGKSRV